MDSKVTGTSHKSQVETTCDLCDVPVTIKNI